MALPPHLPPPTCDIDKHRQWQRIKILLTATVFGLAAGLSGASIMIGWIWPGMGEGDTWVVARRVNSISRNQLKEQVAIEAAERVADVYGSRANLTELAYLPRASFLGQAVMISSDGWLTMYLPALPTTNFRDWRVVLRDGVVYPVDKIIADKLTGLVFIHALVNANASGSGAQFKVASLTDAVPVNSDLFIFDRSHWQWTVGVAKSYASASYPHLDSAPVERLLLNSDFEAGRVVMNGDGRFVGFTLGQRLVLPNQYIARLLPGVLRDQKIIYATLGVEGWYSAEQPLVVDGVIVKGFYVSKGGGILKAGDIILEVNGRLATTDEMWYNIRAGEIVKLKVRRAGKNLDLETKILEKKF